MAKKVDLSQTMSDAAKNIEMAKNSPKPVRTEAPARKTKVKKEKKETEELMKTSIMIEKELFYRMDIAKKMQNHDRKDGEPLVTTASLLSKLLRDYLDKKYPETKQMYELMFK